MNTTSAERLLLLLSTCMRNTARKGSFLPVTAVNSQPLAVTEDRLEVTEYPLPVNLLTSNVLIM